MNDGNFNQFEKRGAGMSRARAIEIINESRADIGDMDADIAFHHMSDEEVIAEAEAIIESTSRGEE